ncbi:hypothetical protein AB870_20090 [Pandoraea faecigallinarum]|uniref:Halovibrin HvnC n=1 Tax=Pandoraea faecigallinarum TaxID=656179 RepID=A0A0H3X2I1_9BURK|nr:hypothetical protein [Pandoraea faecigallinarum]AKM33046.2 hypothetical protein AB870_20090 [Pandoraea faecigallinarum]
MRHPHLHQWSIVVVLVSLLCACTSLPMQTGSPGQSSLASAPRDIKSLHQRGLETIVELYRHYNSTAKDCGEANLPAVLCSGVLIRATENTPDGIAWDPSPSSITSGGTSFSWLRQDTNFSLIPVDRTSGFIFYPKLHTPPDKNGKIDVLCAFPNDGLTYMRDEQGCGIIPSYPDVSRPCDIQGITTAAQWFAMWDAAFDKMAQTCGFNIRPNAKDQADRFMQVILARAMIPDWAWIQWDELRLATWQPGTGKDLPILAFFYGEGNAAGLAGARIDQQKYFDMFGQAIPIVRLSLPPAKGGRAQFSYSDDDQAVHAEGSRAIVR